MSSNTATEFETHATADLNFVLRTADERWRVAEKKLNEALQVIELIAELPRGSMGANYTHDDGRPTPTSLQLRQVVCSLPDSDNDDDSDDLPLTPEEPEAPPAYSP